MIKPYACHNAKRSTRYQVHTRQYAQNGSWRLKPQWIEDVMSKDCKYDLKASDARCAGCLK